MRGPWSFRRFSSKSSLHIPAAAALLPLPPPVTALLRRGLLPEALRASAVHHPIPLTLQLLSLSLKSGLSPDLHLATHLIGRLSHSGHLSEARTLLLHTPAADTAAWNALIAGCARNGGVELAFQLFKELPLHGLNPDAFTLSSLIKASSHGDILATEIVHGVAVKMGFLSAVYVITGLLDNYSKLGELGLAEQCFEECPLFDSGVWTAMVSGYVKNGMIGSAVGTFKEMLDLGLRLNEFCLTSVLAALSDGEFDVKQGKQIHCLSIKVGFLCRESMPLNNALLSMYCRCGTKAEGLRAFGEIQEPDVVSWSTIIRVLNGEEALGLFGFLLSRDVDVNDFTLINVLSVIDGPEFLRGGKQIQAWCFRNGFASIISVGNALVSMYGKCRQIDDAKRVFDEMVERDIVSWNALIAACVANGLPDRVLWLFSWMQHSSFEPNISTLSSLFEAASRFSTSDLAAQIHSYIVKLGHIFDDCIATALITLYGKCGMIDESKQVFDEVDRRVLVHINKMASTFVQAGHHADAIKLFKRTRHMGMEVDNVSLSVVIKAYCAVSSIEQGRNMHSLALKLGIDRDSFVGSGLIDIYCKCGSLGEAIKVFEELPRSNLATWNAMLTGYAQHGCYDKVTNHLKKMIEEGIDPDEITFLGLLYASCHGGHVEEACYYLNSMTEDHGIGPSLEHYACVVDLLGRAGQLEEVKRIIDQMPLSLDARMWQIFLTACSIHVNVKLGEIAAQELLKLEPDNVSAYVLLSNIYATAGKWDEVRILRRGMRERTVCKEPGCSWIEVRGNIHSFLVSDLTHPRFQKFL
ncbi:pentatricopeptide repeat-containing protein At2g13600-like [Phoenix dactylifera]|uniref:Pentatricopeptide repeat-containing protein At2g13600-like n=1 Tax=Phoenix dactylifera TaxID=42345 RepID=A0A8B8ZG50_PHODC|nr:pentatricopeptide repeat-containing protein At2g13600-like [Phoenix dactylifera]XP_038970800.1 pentatricopeptide repeat-containing protein At2g13600-like [Phoenix dactylifera]